MALLSMLEILAQAIPLATLKEEDGSGMYIADTIYLFKSGSGPLLIESTEEDDNKTPLFLIHGIDRVNVPGKADSDNWFNFVTFFQSSQALSNAYKLYIVSYSSNVVSVDKLGSNFGSLLTQLDHVTHGIGGRPFVVIGHSMGGLISRALMNRRQENEMFWGERVIKLITLATPHHGTPFANEIYDGSPLKLAIKPQTLKAWIINYAGAKEWGREWTQSNRSDLLWDKYEPCWLSTFNPVADYNGKLILYAGMYTEGWHPPYTGASFGIPYDIQKIMSDGLGLDGDGAVPLSSASFDNGRQVTNAQRRVTLMDYDHTQMMTGKGLTFAEITNEPLFQSIRADLNSIAPKLPAPFSLSASSVSANGGSFIEITTTARPLIGETYTLFRNSQPYKVFNGVTFSNTQVTPGVTYTYNVKAENAFGSTVSNSVQVTVQNAVVSTPAAPTNLIANAISSTQINLSWNDNSSIETGYIVERKTGANGTYAPIPGSPFTANTTARSDTNLSPSSTYFYRVIASASSNSPPSIEVSTFTQVAITTARVLTVNSINPGNGVHIYISPNDTNGLADGDATFFRQYASPVSATLVAPSTWGGNIFQKWQKDGQDWTTSTVANVVMDSSHTMTVVYTPPAAQGFSISLSSFPTSSGSATGGGTIANGSTVQIVAVPEVGYRFLNWTLNTNYQNGGTIFSADRSANFTATSSLSLVANFVQNNPAAIITTASSPASSGTTSGGGSFQSGALAQISASPANGWEFGTWTDEDGVLVSFSSTFAFPVYQSRNYVAHFNPVLSQNYTLAITSAFNGTAFRVPNQVAYTPGSSVIITATPNAGYLFTGWSESASGTQNPLTVLMTGNLAVAANFSPVPASTYTITLPSRTGGSVSKTPDLPFYSHGSVVTLTPKPDSGYVFGSWRRDTFGNSNPLQITMDGNKTAVADFNPPSPSSAVLAGVAPTSISVPATAGANNFVVRNPGSGLLYWTASPTVSWMQVNGSGSTGVLGGGSSTNGVPVSWEENPTASVRTGEVRVYSPGAQQSPQIFTITQAGGVPRFSLNVAAVNGTVTRTPQQSSYTEGTEVALTAEAIPGYRFTDWNGDATGTQAAISITMNGNKNVTANFQIVPNPDLFLTLPATPKIAYAGTPYLLTGVIGNRGVGLSSACKFYCLFSNSNLTVPSTELTTAAIVNLPGVSDSSPESFSTSVTVPAGFSKGIYYLWMVIDPESASGEMQINRSNNNIVVPFNILPAPPASGPDLVTGDFTVTPPVAFPGSNVRVKGRVSNFGTASSSSCRYYVSISGSGETPPDKNALNSMNVLPSLDIGTDFSTDSVITLPPSLASGNYYLWILLDPENTGGQPSLNRPNDSTILPLTVVPPLQNFTITTGSLPELGGTISGGGNYVNGALAPLSAISNSGYQFLYWTENGNLINAPSVYSFVVEGDRRVVANFASTTPFASWRASHFDASQLFNATVSGWNGDANGSGISNGLKFLFDLDPILPMSPIDWSALPQPGLEMMGGLHYLTLTYRKNPQANSQEVKIEVSGELSPASWEVVTPDFNLALAPDPITTHPRIKAMVNITGQEKKFIRLKIYEP